MPSSSARVRIKLVKGTVRESNRKKLTVDDAGRLPEIPIVVRARYVSAEAERKVTEAGGVVELIA